jgi:small subunit ribosomal protein S1
VVSYGAFVKLEPGVEGLLHISEMSWTKRIDHPSELVGIGDEVDVMILRVDREGEQLSLGMKQTQENPWDRVGERYPEGSTITGKIRNMTNYGAFVELEAGIDGLLHASDMSWTRKISDPKDMLKKGQEVTCRVLSVDQEGRRIALGLKQMDEDPWAEYIPNKYQPGKVLTGKVTKITNFGVFVGLEDDLEGLLHVSELADHRVENPEEVVKVGEEVEVKILRVDTEERKVGLSRKRIEWAEEDEAAAQAKSPLGKEPAAPLKGGLGTSGPLISPISPSADEAGSSDVSEDS